jgi:hypothetical protein
MTISWQQQLRPGVALRQIVQQATKSLIEMDPVRLEELARCCVALNQELQGTGGTAEAADLKDAGDDLKLLGRVLVETRANLTVLSRLHALRIRQHEEPFDQLKWKLKRSERMVDYGDN